MLHHGDITLVRGLVDIDFIFFDVAELDFVVFFGFGVNGRAREGGVERRLACRLVAVTYQLHIQLRRDCGRAGVDDFVLDLDGVAAALQRIGFDQLQAADVRGFKAHGQFVLTLFQGALAAEAHGCFVGGISHAVGCADQAGLSHIHAVAAFVEQDKGLAVVGHVGMLT